MHNGSLTPNPTTAQIIVNYFAENTVSTYLMMVNTTTGSSDNYILDTRLGSTTIDVSTFDM
ncbi:MAG: hypothetical protein JKY22_05480 [Flavobacteriaceae bacterium]|nr:hypothetical protein [Flavobacteriaceae bacterium]